jgi:diacylglycerol kinase family enzyme
MSRRLARDGAAAIVTAGGDGTINTVVNALAGIDVPLGILPLGTANDFARELGIPLDVEAAVHRMTIGTERRIDLVDVNGRAFCTVGGLGLPAACALAVDELRARGAMRAVVGRLGTSVYPAVAAATILRSRRAPQRLRITLRTPTGAEERIDVMAHGLFVANQAALAAGLVLPTGSSNVDGVFELCIVRAVARTRLLAALACLKCGRPTPPGVFIVRAATYARIESSEDETFFGDGDFLGRGRRFDVRMRPRALRVLH